MSQPFPSRSFHSREPKHRRNGKIRAREVRVLDENKQQIGVLTLSDALRLAQSKGLDLVEIAANASVGGQSCRVVRDGERFEVCGMRAEALSVPGHSSDSIVYRVERVLFTGDTLEAGAIGSTLSRYGGNLLRQGLAQKVLSQDESCVILPGHGPPSTVLAERRFNLGFDPALKRKESERYDFFV